MHLYVPSQPLPFLARQDDELRRRSRRHAARPPPGAAPQTKDWRAIREHVPTYPDQWARAEWSQKKNKRGGHFEQAQNAIHLTYPTHRERIQIERARPDHTPDGRRVNLSPAGIKAHATGLLMACREVDFPCPPRWQRLAHSVRTARSPLTEVQSSSFSESAPIRAAVA